MKHRLFWGACLSWSLIAAAVAARALIFSDDIRPARSHGFAVRVNGASQDHEVRCYPGRVEDAERALRSSPREGWIPVAEDLDLASLLLGIGAEETLLTSQARIRVYRKRDDLMILAFAGSGDRTLTWRVVQRSTPPPDRISQNCPVPPPPDATALFCSGSGGLRMASWLMSASPGPAAWARSLGFAVRALRDGDPGGPLLLSKGSRRVMVFCRPATDPRRVSLQVLEYGERTP